MTRVLNPIWENPYLRLFILILIAFGVTYIVYQTSLVWTAFVIALLLANLLNPVLEHFANKSSRALGMLALAGMLVVIGLLIAALGLYVSSQVAHFSRALPMITSTVERLPYQVARTVDPRFGDNFNQVYRSLKGAQSAIRQQTIRYLSAEGEMQTFLLQLANMGGQLGIILILSLYLLYGYPIYIKSFTRIIPHRYRPRIETFVSRFAFAMSGYVRGQLLVGMISGFLFFLLTLLIGVPLAPVLGIIYGVANFIPFFGPIIAAIPTVILAFLEGGTTVIFAILALVIVNQIDGNILSPYIFSRFIAIDPVTVIISLLVGGALFGFAGVILALPVAAFLKVLLMEYYVDSQWYKKSPNSDL